MDLAWWIVYIGVPLVGAIFAVDFYIHRNAEAELQDAVTKKNKEISELYERFNALNKELYDYKVMAAQMFATMASVSEVKREMLAALSRIEDKLDRIGERNERRDRS